MASIIYKGKDYANNIINKGVLYTSENDEFIIDRENLEPIELHAGAQKIYGNIGGNFVAAGHYVYNRPILDIYKDELLTKERLYSNIWHDSAEYLNVYVGEVNSTSIKIYVRYRTAKNVDPLSRIYGHAIVKNIDSTSQDYNTYYFKDQGSEQSYIQIKKTQKPKYFGCFLWFRQIYTNYPLGKTYGIEPILTVFNEQGELIPFTFSEHSRFNSNEEVYGVRIFSSRYDPCQFAISDIEEQYYKGLTEIKTHISSSQYAKNYADGAINGYYNSSESSTFKFYSDYDISTATFSNQITPEIDKFYLDRLTNKVYTWNGTTYEMLIE